MSPKILELVKELERRYPHLLSHDDACNIADLAQRTFFGQTRWLKLSKARDLFGIDPRLIKRRPDLFKTRPINPDAKRPTYEVRLEDCEEFDERQP